jgi:hypothetical protein
MNKKHRSISGDALTRTIDLGRVFAFQQGLRRNQIVRFDSFPPCGFDPDRVPVRPLSDCGPMTCAVCFDLFPEEEDVCNGEVVTGHFLVLDPIHFLHICSPKHASLPLHRFWLCMDCGERSLYGDLKSTKLLGQRFRVRAKLGVCGDRDHTNVRGLIPRDEHGSVPCYCAEEIYDAEGNLASVRWLYDFRDEYCYHGEHFICA